MSYKAEDRPRVTPLVHALEAEGFSVWWDDQIEAGANWRSDIEEQLNGARCVIVAWSKRSVGRGGEFVRDEAAQARRLGTYLPVRLDKVEPPLGFREVQAVSLERWHGDRSDPRFSALISTVRRRMRGEQPGESYAWLPEQRVSRRSAMIAAAAVAAAGSAAFAGWRLLRPQSATEHSIAVLPFANLSGDSRQDYFCDGIAEELRSALSQLPGLEVVGRISSEAVRSLDTKSVGRRLHVGNILIGSVRRAPGVVRISSQLVDGISGLEKWSATYDRADGNVLEIQTDIAENVVTALALQLANVRLALAVGGTQNAQALDLYLQAARHAQSDDSESSLRDANMLLDGAIAKDPRFAKAYAAKSRNLSYIADVGHSPGEIANGYAAAAAAAKRAISLAPTLPEAYAALADALYGQRNISAAVRQIDAGAKFGRNDLQLLQAAVVVFVAGNQTRRALSFADRMVRIDPLNPLAHRRRYYALFYDRQFDGAIEEARRTMKLAPGLALPPYFIALSLILKGNAAGAEQFLAMLPRDLTVRLAGDAIVADKLGDRKTSNARLQQLKSKYGDAASYQFAEVYAQRSDGGKAFAALDRALAVSDPGLNTLVVDPLFDPVRSDPRFAALLDRVQIP